MKRIAILIGSPGKPHLNGVSQDIKNIKAFLKSSNGGGWAPEEIKETRLNPSGNTTLTLLDSIVNVDFAFVYFSGHGFTDDDNTGKINVNSDEVLNISDLANRCKKQITIIDACRGYSDYSGFDGSTGRLTFTFDATNIEGSKAVYNEHINACENGKVLLFASQRGENAQDTDAGGIFSTNILWAAKHLVDNTNEAIINVYSVFNQAKDWTKIHHTPEIKFTIEAALKFPFAVKTPRLEKNIAQKSSHDGIGVIARVLAFIGATLLIGAIFSDSKKK